MLLVRSRRQRGATVEHREMNKTWTRACPSPGYTSCLYTLVESLLNHPPPLLRPSPHKPDVRHLLKTLTYAHSEIQCHFRKKRLSNVWTAESNRFPHSWNTWGLFFPMKCWQMMMMMTMIILNFIVTAQTTSTEATQCCKASNQKWKTGRKLQIVHIVKYIINRMYAVGYRISKWSGKNMA